MEEIVMTTADVARRLGVSSATVQRWAAVLRKAGYLKTVPGPNGVPQAVWTPELIELVEFLKSVSESSGGRISFKRALELVEVMGRQALALKRGQTYAEAIILAAEAAERSRVGTEEARQDLLRAVKEARRDLEWAVKKLREEVVGLVRSVGLEDVEQEAEQLRLEMRRAAAELKRATSWVRWTQIGAGIAFALLLLGLVVVSLPGLHLPPVPADAKGRALWLLAALWGFITSQGAGLVAGGVLVCGGCLLWGWLRREPEPW